MSFYWFDFDPLLRLMMSTTLLWDISWMSESCWVVNWAVRVTPVIFSLTFSCVCFHSSFGRAEFFYFSMENICVLTSEIPSVCLIMLIKCYLREEVLRSDLALLHVDWLRYSLISLYYSLMEFYTCNDVYVSCWITAGHFKWGTVS